MPTWLSIVIVVLSFLGMAMVVDGPFLLSLDMLARRLRLPSDVAGATLLAFGTSAPEISTALVALFAEGTHPATGVGSIVGSAIFQVLVVVGFAAMVRAARLDWRPVLRDSLVYAFSVLLLVLFIRDDRFTLVEASVLLGTYGLYLGLMWWWARRFGHEEDAHEPSAEAPPAPRPRARPALSRLVHWPTDQLVALLLRPSSGPRWMVPVFVICLGLIGYACYWLVFAAEALARALSVPPAIIALTILAGGSSIPELVSSASVARQGRGGMAIANAIGSNTFDVLVSLGLPVWLFCLWHGDLEGVGGDNMSTSVTLLFLTLVAVVGVMALRRFRIGRFFGALLVAAYALYVVAAYLGWIG